MAVVSIASTPSRRLPQACRSSSTRLRRTRNFLSSVYASIGVSEVFNRRSESKVPVRARGQTETTINARQVRQEFEPTF
ncbi:unnamed protein product [Protopolystoma xenopodis]|uniref:Uncharacterized protein n=1 Tax=Protopolystoma xenopodis TaxID=117903 RepID=A0A448XL02_9PLAT|nr:unnamed protein product [Protopolystoma xenopodis]